MIATDLFHQQVSVIRSQGLEGIFRIENGQLSVHFCLLKTYNGFGMFNLVQVGKEKVREHMNEALQGVVPTAIDSKVPA